MVVGGSDLLLEGRAALRAGDGAGARLVLERALADGPSGDVLEGLAKAAFLELDFRRAVDFWERAYAAHRADGNQVGSVRVARGVACIYLSAFGDRAVAGGWLARACSLLSGEAGESPERGWVELDLGMFESNRQSKEEHFRTALAVARQSGDTDLEFVTLAYLGASLVHGDRVSEGMVLLDEALAAVAGSDVEDFFVLEEIFCQLFSACEHAHDVARADEWIRVGEAIARRRNLPAVSAFCRTHYGGVLTAAGRWPEADTTLREAVQLWGPRSILRGGALVRLAELRVRQGRFEEAEQLLDGMPVNPDTARPLAAVHLANGRAGFAREILHTALDEAGPDSTEAARLVALLVDACLADDRLDEARVAAERLATCATSHPNNYLTAAAALARGRVCLAAGTGDPRACLREAIAGFTRAQMPMELACARLELADALAAERPDVAAGEARAALATFTELQAERHADAAAATLRSLGIRPTKASRSPASTLTKREAEVLVLLGYGLSNPEIADRLFISRKTVEHHVGNILAKLGLRGRAEAAAYAARGTPAEE